MANPVITGPGSIAAVVNVPYALGISLTDVNQPHAGNCALTVTCGKGSLLANGVALTATMNDTFTNCQSELAALSYVPLSTGTDVIYVDFWNQLGMNVGLSIAVNVIASAAPSAPTALNATGIGQTSFTMNWTKSANGSAPIGYQAKYRLHGTSTWTDVPAPVSQTITGLAPGTSYDVQVTAINTAGIATSAATTITTGSSAGMLPGDVNGIQAARIGDLMGQMGYNTYSSPDANSSLWGSWPADNSLASVVAGVRFLKGTPNVDDSGHDVELREYHYPGARATLQASWCPAVAAAVSGKFTIALGGGADATAVPSLQSLAQSSFSGTKWLRRVEGLNEPNTDFGSGETPPATTIAIQQALNTAVTGLGVDVCGPSVVFGLPTPENYFSAYATTQQYLQMGGFSAVANGHLYPPAAPDDGTSRNGAMHDTAVGLTTEYGLSRKIITEWHPTIFGQAHNLDPAYDCYYAPLYILAAFREGFEAYFWYSLMDYGWIAETSQPRYKSGVFPQTGGVNPRPVAYTLQAMYKLCPDKGAAKRTFTPSKLDIRVSGGEAPVANSPNTGTHLDVFQASDGTFYVYLKNAQTDPGGATQPVTITFPSHPVASVKTYLVSDTVSPMTLRSSAVNVSSMTIQLNRAVWLLVIKY